jgi:two-component system NarL family response regulator
MRILIVDDHPIYAEGLKNLLLSWGYGEVSVARDGPEAIALAAATGADVILMDIGLPGMDGIEATAEIKKARPEAKIVMLTSLGEEESLFRAIRAGASGYLIKTLNGEELVRCLSDLKEGRNPFSPGMEESLLAQLRRGYAGSAPRASDEARPDLTRRQRDVLRLVVAGKSYKEIGQELFISERTVKFHVEQAKEAFGTKSKDRLVELFERDERSRAE